MSTFAELENTDSFLVISDGELYQLDEQTDLKINSDTDVELIRFQDAEMITFKSKHPSIDDAVAAFVTKTADYKLT